MGTMSNFMTFYGKCCVVVCCICLSMSIAGGTATLTNLNHQLEIIIEYGMNGHFAKLRKKCFD